MRSAPVALCVLAASATTAWGTAGAPAAQTPSLREVLERAGKYSVAYGSALVSVVADEDFVQQLVAVRDGSTMQRRHLRSEIAFVWLAGREEWLGFRNVLQADGVELPGAAGELDRIFREAPESALRQARALTAASARFNLGPIQRNFNVPTTVLQFVLPQHQARFRFRKAAEEQIQGERVWLVDFRERGRATFIRTPEGRDAPASGRLWIVPADGRVVRSRLTVHAGVEAEIDVSWTAEPRLRLWVPDEMRERYRGPWGATPDRVKPSEPYEIRGIARYSNYRRFEVDIRIGGPSRRPGLPGAPAAAAPGSTEAPGSR